MTSLEHKLQHSLIHILQRPMSISNKYPFQSPSKQHPHCPYCSVGYFYILYPTAVMTVLVPDFPQQERKVVPTDERRISPTYSWILVHQTRFRHGQAIRVNTYLTWRDRSEWSCWQRLHRSNDSSSPFYHLKLEGMNCWEDKLTPSMTVDEGTCYVILPEIVNS